VRAGADIVIAADLQHDTHVMRQSLNYRVSVPVDKKISTGWSKRLRRLTAHQTRVTSTAMQIISTSIQALKNRFKRSRMAGYPPNSLLQPFCPQFSTLDFYHAGEAIAVGMQAVEKKMDELFTSGEAR
jgi:predicted acylesterase/phospholipase RssA